MNSFLLLVGLIAGQASISTPECTVSASGYHRDEGTPTHVRHRIVLYGTGCDFGTDVHTGMTRVQYTSKGSIEFDVIVGPGKQFHVSMLPDDPADRATYGDLRQFSPAEAERDVLVFLVVGRLEIIAEDTFPPPIEAK